MYISVRNKHGLIDKGIKPRQIKKSLRENQPSLRKKMCKVSILIVCYNQEKYISSCIESCIEQATFNDYEIVITDDASTDLTMSIIEGYQQKYPALIKVAKSDLNLGISSNINKGFSLCRGEWIKVLAADDLLEKDCLDKFIMATTQSNIDVYFSEMNLINAYGDTIGYTVTNKNFFRLPKEKMLHVLYRKNVLSAPTAFIKNNVIKKINGSDTRFPMIEDLPMWIKLLNENFKIGFIDERLVKYRISDSVSNPNNKIGNLSYFESLLDFRKIEIWPRLTGIDKLHIVNDYFLFGVIIFSIKNLSNNKSSLIYKALKTCVIPFRLFSIIRNHLCEYNVRHIYD